MTNKVLTAEDCEFEQPKEIREILAYLDDGRLLISKTHSFNHHVRAFQARLQRIGREVNPMMVDMKVIADAYAAAQSASSNGSGDRGSRTQETATALFRRAAARRASDIHIRVSKKDKTRIFFRVLGDLEFIEEDTYEHGVSMCTAIYQTMADVADPVFEMISHQDARIADKSRIPEGLDGIRIATTPQVDGFVMVLRMLYNATDNATDLVALGYSSAQDDAVRFLRRRPHGINFISGPTGSGKSTTLQRILGAIHLESRGKKNIITVEDPPEYGIPGAVQTPVTNAETEEERSRAFQAAIKAALRLDPDVIMIGEVRDYAAARLAIQAAMTGHQVWTTLHTNNAFGIIDRLVDLGIERELIADPNVLSGMICQRLVQKLCPHCRVPFTVVMEDLLPRDRDRMLGTIDAQSAFVMGSGCAHCGGTGLIGRVAVVETVIADHTLMSHVRANDKQAMIDYWRRDQQGKTMLEMAIELVNSGLIDPFAAEDEVGPLTISRIESDHRVNQHEVSVA